MKKYLSIITMISVFLSCFVVGVFGAESEKMTVLFTHDIHDYYYPTETMTESGLVEHGGAARLATLIKENSDDSTIYIDAGDFSMGTLYQSAYATDAYELRTLGLTGCAVTTLGNHEFDFGAKGVADMLRAAKDSGDMLPQIVQTNIDLSGELTADQKEMKKAMEEYGVKPYIIREIGEYKVGIFGVVGYECIDCIQTELSYVDYIESAKSTVKDLETESCDVIIALSHTGTDGDGVNGEDFDLAKEVPEIDLIISGHSHSSYSDPIFVGNTAVVCCGKYLENLGKLTFVMNAGKLSVSEFSLLKIDSTVKEDTAVAEHVEHFIESINDNHLESMGTSFDEVICHSNYSFMSLDKMYAVHEEFPLGNLIADSYIYEAKKNGIDDIDVAVVGLGTIRGAFREGNITTADAFEICSLGAGSDGSSGHPLIVGYITGKELKLLSELDASLGGLESSVKLSYSGLSVTFNTKRIILDRVTDVHLVRDDGTTEEIEDEKLYKVVGNLYALNMLSVVSSRTKGLISILPKYEDGTVIDDFYSASMKSGNNTEIKEWVALWDYLKSFDIGENGVPEIPDMYGSTLGRKTKVSEGGLSAVSNPGTACNIMPILILALAAILVLIIGVIVMAVRRKKIKKRK